MTFPSGPNDQGFSEEPAFSQQPVFQTPPPVFSHQPGFGQPSYPTAHQPVPPRAPSAATGIIAAVLALLGGLAGLVLGILIMAAVISKHRSEAPPTVVALLCITSGLALLIGAIQLWRHKPISRGIIAGGCAAIMLAGALFLIEGFTNTEPSAAAIVTIALLDFIFPIVTLVLTMLPSTKAWIETKQNPIAPQYYPPYQH
ncbi:hypothetical protein A5667_25495 [Mycolicibacterium fortuitum]|uniref:hypothetical protein n=1 Tax=Mycolicibacterium fortuitum TaxID=1766 RepID=UPI0007EC6AF2|nr:hypothetical protein [Mycolicibacterium fortuitum]OBI54296.1 hypothetical protein A5667_25495 [Mycolicibacterium fortuitum]